MIYSVDPRNWIVTLFIRSDGERFVLGTGAYDFKSSQLHFAGNSIQNDVVELQGSDGQLLAGQVKRSQLQSFDGYVADFLKDKTTTENYRAAFYDFFQTNYYYQVVYVFTDGMAIKRMYGYLVDAPEVRELYQMSPQYHVALNFEDVNYYRYLENEDGEEIATSEIDVAIEGGGEGGLVWDETGVVWEALNDDAPGAQWEEGGEVYVTIQVATMATIYPTWTVTGFCTNPTIQNITTGTELSYNGTVAAGQKLVVDSAAQTALLDGVNVADDISGSWLTIQDGTNKFFSTVTAGDITSTKLSWSEIVG